MGGRWLFWLIVVGLGLGLGAVLPVVLREGGWGEKGGEMVVGAKEKKAEKLGFGAGASRRGLGLGGGRSNVVVNLGQEDEEVEAVGDRLKMLKRSAGMCSEEDEGLGVCGEGDEGGMGRESLEVKRERVEEERRGREEAEAGEKARGEEEREDGGGGGKNGEKKSEKKGWRSRKVKGVMPKNHFELQDEEWAQVFLLA